MQCANSRTVQLEQQLTMALSGQQDLEQQMLSLTRSLEAAKADRKVNFKNIRSIWSHV